MPIRKNNILSNILKTSLFASATCLIGFSSAFAGDVGKQLPEYEKSLLGEDSNYPTVGLRKKMNDDCYCSGAYFTVSSGYAVGGFQNLTKGLPIEDVSGLPANVQPAIVNPGALNEAVPGYGIGGHKIVASAGAGYKFANFRVEATGEFATGFATNIAGSGINNVTVSTNTNRFTGLMSGYYDIDIDGLPITPYVGGGVGLSVSQASINATHSVGGVDTVGALKYNSSFAFTSAAMAGVALKLGGGLTFDVGYKLTNIAGGSATYAGSENGAAINAAFGGNLINPSGMGLGARSNGSGGTTIYQETLDFPSLSTHELKAGIRYTF